MKLCWVIAPGHETLFSEMSLWMVRTGIDDKDPRPEHEVAALHFTDELTGASLGGDGQIYLAVDGSWNVVTQRIGTGALLRDQHSNWISGLSMSFDQENAFLVEILAMETGLSHAWDLGFRNIHCVSDCSQVVDVFRNSMNVSAFWARDTIVRVRALIPRSGEWRLTMSQERGIMQLTLISPSITGIDFTTCVDNSSI